MEKQVITTTSAPGAVGPYVQATKLENIIYCSGQLGINPAEGKLAATVEEQAHCSMKNLGAILREAGSDYSKILKTTIFFMILLYSVCGIISRGLPYREALNFRIRGTSLMSCF